MIDIEDDGQNIQKFMSDSPWLASSVFSQIQTEICQRPELTGGMLTLYESGDERSGSSRQMIGRLGKVDMGQVGVALGYYKNSIWSMVDTMLYLPEEWFDKEHEKLAIVGMFQSTVGLKMIKEAKAKGMPFEVVGCDTTYKYRKSSFCHDGAIVKDTNPSFLGWVKSAKVQISFLCIVSCKKVVCRLLILLTLI